MAKLRMAHASTHGPRYVPIKINYIQPFILKHLNNIHVKAELRKYMQGSGSYFNIYFSFLRILDFDYLCSLYLLVKMFMLYSYFMTLVKSH